MSEFTEQGKHSKEHKEGPDTPYVPKGMVADIKRALEAWIWRPGRLDAWMLDAGRIGVDWNGWLLDGRRGSKDIPPA